MQLLVEFSKKIEIPRKSVWNVFNIPYFLKKKIVDLFLIKFLFCQTKYIFTTYRKLFGKKDVF